MRSFPVSTSSSSCPNTCTPSVLGFTSLPEAGGHAAEGEEGGGGAKLTDRDHPGPALPALGQAQHVHQQLVYVGQQQVAASPLLCSVTRCTNRFPTITSVAIGSNPVTITIYYYYYYCSMLLVLTFITDLVFGLFVLLSVPS